MSLAKKYALIDLHLHLDGSISLSSARALAKMQGIELDDDDKALLSRLTVGEDCKDLNEYLEKFDFPLSLLQTEEAIGEAVYRLCEELSEQGLIYAEIRFAPQLHTRKGLTQREVVEAAIRGKNRSSFKSSLILCCMRGDENTKENMTTVSVAKEFIGVGVCAVDLAGAEALFKTETFSELFAYAKSLDLPFTIHAGEADGPQSVRLALDYGAKRIGHGVRSIEDDLLVKRLAESGVALELCPTSNLNTRVFERIEDYPIKRLLAAGVKVTLNTDNITVSNTTLAREYELIMNVLGLSEDELEIILANSISATFLSEEEKKKLI